MSQVIRSETVGKAKWSLMPSLDSYLFNDVRKAWNFLRRGGAQRACPHCPFKLSASTDDSVCSSTFLTVNLSINFFTVMPRGASPR